MANLTFSHNFLSQAFFLGASPLNALKVTHNACYAGYIFMWSSNPGYAALIALAFFIPDNFPSPKRRVSNFGVKSKLFKWLRVCLRYTSLFWSWKAFVFQNTDYPPPPNPFSFLRLLFGKLHMQCVDYKEIMLRLYLGPLTILTETVKL